MTYGIAFALHGAEIDSLQFARLNDPPDVSVEALDRGPLPARARAASDSRRHVHRGGAHALACRARRRRPARMPAALVERSHLEENRQMTIATSPTA